jgi:hypothetical protein
MTAFKAFPDEKPPLWRFDDIKERKIFGASREMPSKEVEGASLTG